MELFIRAGAPLQEAAMRVSRTAKDWPWHQTKKVTAQTVKKWRERAMAGLVGEDFDATTFRELVDYAKKSEADYEVISMELLNNPPWMR